jgi:hypothetical protein
MPEQNIDEFLDHKVSAIAVGGIGHNPVEGILRYISDRGYCIETENEDGKRHVDIFPDSIVLIEEPKEPEPEPPHIAFTEKEWRIVQAVFIQTVPAYLQATMFEHVCTAHFGGSEVMTVAFLKKITD